MTKIFRALWFLFLLPGVLILWLEYMFPSKGNAIASARRRKSKPVTVLMAILGWFFILYLLPFEILKFY